MPELYRSMCDRICDVEWCSMVCFLRRGYIWDKSKHSFCYDKNGIALRTKERLCDWELSGEEKPKIPGGFGAGEGQAHFYDTSTGRHYKMP